MRAGEWARHELGALSSRWSAGSAGLPVPYPVQIDGTEILMEFIDLPQVIDIVGNQNGVEFLLRDCRNVCRWFASRGLDIDADELLGELLAQAW